MTLQALAQVALPPADFDPTGNRRNRRPYSKKQDFNTSLGVIQPILPQSTDYASPRCPDNGGI